MTTSKQKINIAIDGYSACGKSSVAKLLAKKLNYIYIDSGAMYRAVTLYALERGIIKDNSIYKPSLLRNLPELDISFEKGDKEFAETYLNGENVEKSIRTLEVSRYVSQVSSLVEVREKLVALQRKMGKKKGVVMDGRDIGSTVFPDAELKFFMVSDMDLRVNRRYEELVARGDKITLKEVEENLRKRDYADTTRQESPLIKPNDAIEINNSEIDLDELVDQLYQIVVDKIEELNQVEV